MAIISIKNLSKNYEHSLRSPGVLGAFKGLFHRKKTKVEAVKNISFEIKEGEFVGFIGPNGAGKTTTLKMLSGILTPTSGEASVLGFRPQDRKPAFQKQFAIVMGQKNQLWWDLPAIETFELNKVIYDIPNDRYEQNLDELTELLEIKNLLDVPVRKLSLGERMKCELTAALLHSPKVLFLDEPTIGLDVISQRNIRDFLRQYNEKFKATIILTSHYMEDIRRLCERVMIIDHGRLLYDGTYQNLTDQYADTKSIDMTFRNEVSKSQLEPFGIVREHRPLSARIEIPRKDATKIVTELLRIFPIEDISIHEESMEEIVSEIFQNSPDV